MVRHWVNYKSVDGNYRRRQNDKAVSAWTITLMSFYGDLYRLI